MVARAPETEGQPLDEPFVGRLVGGFLLERRLGTGASGEVWLGRHTVSGGLGAAKILHASAQGHALVRDYFGKEWQVIQRLEHPNIIRVFATGEDFLVTAFVDGTNLARRLRSPMDPAEGLAICLQIASALSHAHRRGVVHRDVKPGNILLDRQGNAFLADFGLARVDGEEDRASIVGTVGYMAPEQRRSSDVGPEADQYALARVLIEILAGISLPTDRDQALEALPASTPKELVAILDRATSALPSARYGSMREFIAGVRAVSAGALTGQSPLAPVRRDPATFSWMAGGQVVSEPDQEIWEADYSLARLAEAGLLPESALSFLGTAFGLGDLGWSVFGRRARLGEALDPAAFARATDVVVLLHGGGATRTIWAPIARSICQSDAQTIVLTPDVGGYGQSPFLASRTAEHISSRSLGRCALHFLAELGVQTIPTVLVGHSMSGVAMLTLRDDELGPLRTRVAVSPVFPQYHRYMRFQLRFGAALFRAIKGMPRTYKRLARWTADYGALTRALTQDTKDRCFEIYRDTDPDTAIAALEGMLHAEFAPGDQLRRALLLTGLDDPLAPPKVVEKAVTALKLPSVRTKSLAKGGHMPLLELHGQPGSTAQNHDAITRAIQSMMLEAEGESGAQPRRPSTRSRESLAFGSTAVPGELDALADARTELD